MNFSQKSTSNPRILKQLLKTLKHHQSRNISSSSLQARLQFTNKLTKLLNSKLFIFSSSPALCIEASRNSSHCITHCTHKYALSNNFFHILLRVLFRQIDREHESYKVVSMLPCPFGVIVRLMKGAKKTALTFYSISFIKLTTLS